MTASRIPARAGYIGNETDRDVPRGPHQFRLCLRAHDIGQRLASELVDDADKPFNLLSRVRGIVGQDADNDSAHYQLKRDHFRVEGDRNVIFDLDFGHGLSSVVIQLVGGAQ